MGKSKKQSGPLWMVLSEGILLSLSVWLIGTLALAGGMTMGMVGEEGSFPLLAALTAMAALAGTGFTVRRRAGFPWTLAAAGGFTALLALCALLVWQRLDWTGHGGVLLLSALLGGALPALLGSLSGNGKKRSRRRSW